MYSKNLAMMSLLKNSMITASTLFLLLLHTYYIPAPIAAKMVCIAYEESKFKTDAINYNTNGTTDSGLFQINSVWANKCDNLFNLNDNIECAIVVYKQQGLTAWSTHKKCT